MVSELSSKQILGCWNWWYKIFSYLSSVWSPAGIWFHTLSYIYINDLFHFSRLLSFVLFADDTNIIFYSWHKDISALSDTVNAELINVLSWFKANRLTLHIDKTLWWRSWILQKLRVQVLYFYAFMTGHVMFSLYVLWNIIY